MYPVAAELPINGTSASIVRLKIETEYRPSKVYPPATIPAFLRACLPTMKITSNESPTRSDPGTIIPPGLHVQVLTEHAEAAFSRFLNPPDTERPNDQKTGAIPRAAPSPTAARN